jgi:dTDP-4-dehydrorhamnose 3,5-epimerase
MKIEQTPLPGFLVFEPRVFGDERGFFLESFQKRRYKDAGIALEFVQDNHSRSQRGVLRGLHFQMRHPQGKLVYVPRGEIFDVAVDIRKGSPNYLKWHGVVLSDENHRQAYIPPGFAHGFCVLSETADVFYKVTDFYQPGDEAGLAWNDPDIGVEWPLTEPILSAKDAEYPGVAAIDPAKLPEFLT